MPDKKTTADKSTASTEVEKALSSLGPLAQVVGKSAGYLWGIFIRKYVAIGLAQLVTAVGVSWISLWLLPDKSMWLFVSFGIAGIFLYCAIVNLINPQYYALNDVIVKVKDLKEPPTVVVPTSYR
jgi:hypothetical protein